MIGSLRRILAVTRREFAASLASPASWVFLVIFLVANGICTFVLMDALGAGQADLGPFFNLLPSLFMFLVPALGMPFWAEERRTGAFELTLSFPATLWELVVGKYLAGMLFLLIALLLTAPVPITYFWLGEPDVGSILCGYFGAFMVGSAFLAASCFCSALTRSQMASFLLAFLICALLLFTGMDAVAAQLYRWLPEWLCRAIAAIAIMPHYQAFQRGLFDTSELAYCLLLTALFLYFARTALRYIASGGGGVFLAGAWKDRYAWRQFGGLALSFLLAGYAFYCLSATFSAFRIRLDCTADRVYSLLPDTREIAATLPRPVALRLYVSPPGEGMPKELVAYAERVKWTLSEFVRASNGKAELEIISLGTDSPEEDAAALDGIEAKKTPDGERHYLGLSISCGPRNAAIPYLSTRTENLFEYELCRRIRAVTEPKKAKVGVLSSFPVMGRPPAPQKGDSGAPRWLAFAELARDWQLVELSPDVREIPSDLAALIVLHPSGFSQRARYAVDQWLLRGGRLAVFTDPQSAYALLMAVKTKNYGLANFSASEFEPLVSAWGFEAPAESVAADLEFKSDRIGANGALVTVPTALAVTDKGLSKTDPATARLSALRLEYAGFFRLARPDAGLKYEPVLFTTDMAREASISDIPEKILASFSSNDKAGLEKLTMGWRIEGMFPTAYPSGPPGGGVSAESLKRSTKPGMVYLFGDCDFLFNDACSAQIPDEFRQNLVIRRNDNLALLENVVSSLVGARDLSRLRTRAPLSRPLTKIVERRMRADLEFKERALALGQEMIRLEKQTEALRNIVIASGGRHPLTEEQKELLDNYERTKEDYARELRRSTRELKRDVNAINNAVRLVNIVVAPAGVMLLGIFWMIFRRLKWRRFK